MKRKFYYRIAGILGITAIIFTGCYRDVTNPGDDPNAPPQFVSFNNDLQPIFTQNCATSGCHDSKPTHAPSLVEGKAYNAVTSGGFINTAVPHSSLLYTAVKSGSMPPGGPLKNAEVVKILDWIRNGAPNN
jgi:hypothetical protein